MSKVSFWRMAGVATRVAGKQISGTRIYRAATGAVRATFRSFGRVVHQLWLEVTGLIFLVMALTGIGATIREYGKYHAGHVGAGRLIVAAGFTLTFAWFTMSSFWRARRKSRS